MLFCFVFVFFLLALVAFLDFFPSVFFLSDHHLLQSKYNIYCIFLYSFSSISASTLGVRPNRLRLIFLKLQPFSCVVVWIMCLREILGVELLQFSQLKCFFFRLILGDIWQNSGFMFGFDCLAVFTWFMFSFVGMR